jgi:hypothetical protein
MAKSLRKRAPSLPSQKRLVTCVLWEMLVSAAVRQGPLAMRTDGLLSPQKGRLRPDLRFHLNTAQVSDLLHHEPSLFAVQWKHPRFHLALFYPLNDLVGR